MPKRSWSEMDSKQKIKALRPLLADGMAFSAIATKFKGATKNSVCGFVFRHREELNHVPDPARLGRKGSAVFVPTAPKHIEAPKVVAMPRPVFRSAPPPVGTVTLLGAAPHQCRRPLWPDRPPPVDEQFVCGAAIEFTDSSYCEDCRKVLFNISPSKSKKRAERRRYPQPALSSCADTWQNRADRNGAYDTVPLLPLTA